MLFHGQDPTPYDLPALVALGLVALLLLAGLVWGPQWPVGLASGLRRGALIAAIAIVAALLVATPTENGIVGAWRLISLWPASALCLLLYLAWAWRSGRP